MTVSIIELGLNHIKREIGTATCFKCNSILRAERGDFKGDPKRFMVLPHIEILFLIFIARCVNRRSTSNSLNSSGSKTG